MLKSPLLVGTRIIAVKNIGLVQEGAIGVVTGIANVPFFFWSRPFYLCTFAGNFKVAVRPKEISGFDHGYDLNVLEDPNFEPDFDEVFRRVISRHESAGKN